MVNLVDSNLILGILTAISALLGALIGSLSTYMIQSFKEKRDDKRKLDYSLQKCLDRLEKIDDVFDNKPKLALDEKYYLGGDMDNYFASIVFTGRPKEHLKIYKYLKLILLNDEVNIETVRCCINHIKKEIKE